MQTNMVDMLKTICILIFSVLIIAANDCYSSSNQDEINFNKSCYFTDKFRVGPSVSKFGDSGGCCLNAIKFTIIDLFSGDYVCNLQPSDKQYLCKIIGTTLLKKCIFKKELKNGDKIEDMVAHTNSSCISNSVNLFYGDVNQRMLPCAVTFKMHDKDEFLPFYVSRTYEWRMPSFWNNNRNVFVYLNEEILDGKKVKEKYLLKQESINQQQYDMMVKLVGESNEFSFDSNELEQRAKLQ